MGVRGPPELTIHLHCSRSFGCRQPLRRALVHAQPWEAVPQRVGRGEEEGEKAAAPLMPHLRRTNNKARMAHLRLNAAVAARIRGAP